jgi:Tol biopolymer transport system component
MAPSAPPLRATLASCEAGSVLFSATSENVNKSGIYLACSDGSSLQQIVSSTALLSKNWSLDEIAISANGHLLAVLTSKYSPSQTSSRIYFWDLLNQQQIASYSIPYFVHDITWLSDSAHVAYIAKNDSGDKASRIEVVRVDTQTVSTILASDLPLNNLVGADDSMQVVYVRVIDEDLRDYKVYLAQVDCEEVGHTCTLASQRPLEWFHAGPSTHLSWVPRSKRIVAINGSLDKAGNIIDVFELWSLDGNNLQTVDLSKIVPARSYGFFPPSTSSDGKRVAFIARPSQQLVADIFVLNLDVGTVEDLSIKLGGLQNPYFDQVVWVPAH